MITCALDIRRHIRTGSQIPHRMANSYHQTWNLTWRTLSHCSYKIKIRPIRLHRWCKNRLLYWMIIPASRVRQVKIPGFIGIVIGIPTCPDLLYYTRPFFVQTQIANHYCDHLAAFRRPSPSITSKVAFFQQLNLRSVSHIQQRLLTYSSASRMPLVVPGINSADGTSTDSWMQKLAGKKITESGSTDDTNFAKKDLPQNHRVVGEDSMVTMDMNPDR